MVFYRIGLIIPDVAVDIYCGLTGQCLEGIAKRHLL
jgi:hypothetical protein